MKTNTFRPLICSLALLSTLLISSVSSAATNKMYYLKGDPVTGSHIPKIEASSAVSFRKSYADLDANEQAIFKKKFDGLSATDTPPFPKLGLRTIYRPIVKANRKVNATGSLNLQATVNANGLVESVKIINSPDSKLSVIAEKTLFKTKFDPASCDGVSCKMNFPLEITFK